MSNIFRQINSIKNKDRGLTIENPYFLKLPGSQLLGDRPGSVGIMPAEEGMIRYNKATNNVEIYIPEHTGGNPQWISLGLGYGSDINGTDGYQGDFMHRFGDMMYGDLRMADSSQAAAVSINSYGLGQISAADNNARVLNSKGSENEPSYTFDGDRETGMYKDDTSDSLALGIHTNRAIQILAGTSRDTTHTIIEGDLTVNGLSVSFADNIIILNKNEAGAGVTASPTFGGIEIERGTQTNTGWLFDESNDWWGPHGAAGAIDSNFQKLGNIQEIDTSTASTKPNVLLVTGNSIQLKGSLGTASDPSFSWDSDSSTGIYSPAAGSIGLTLSGSDKLILNSTGLELLSGVVKIPNGTSGSPAIQFSSSPTTGVRSSATDYLTLVTAGSDRLEIRDTGIAQFKGTAATILPVGTTGQRPTGEDGMIRYNTTSLSFEGFSNGSWASIAGVGSTITDQDADTYISSEDSLGADNDQLKFFTGGPTGAGSNPVLRMVIQNTANGGNVEPGATNTVDLGASSTIWKDVYTNRTLLGAGSSSSPSLTFNGDTNTGVYSAGADQLNFTTNGVDRLTITNTTSTFSNNVTISGNLTVSGTTTSVNSTNLDVVDNVIKVNKDEIGAGVSLSYSGLEVERGTLVNSTWLYDETNDWWGPYGDSTAPLVSVPSTVIGNVSEIATRTASATFTVDGDAILMKGSLGSAVAPSYSWNTDSNTGLYSPGADTLGLSAGGTLIATVASTGLTVNNGVIKVLSGTAASPTYSFSSSSSTGVYSSGANALSIATNGSQVLEARSTGIVQFTSTGATLLPVGTSLQRPTGEDGMIRYNSTIMSFEGFFNGNWSSVGGTRDVDQDTYISAEDSPGADNDQLKMFTAGQLRFTVDSTGHLIPGTSNSYNIGSASSTVAGVYANNVVVSQGSVSSPAVTFNGDTDTGVYSPSAGKVAVASNGDVQLTVNPATSTDADVEINGTGAVVVPVGTTAQRPSNPVDGMIRYNTDRGWYEAYRSGGWRVFAAETLSKAVAESIDNVIVPDKFQKIVYGSYTVELGGSITIEVGGELVIL